MTAATTSTPVAASISAIRASMASASARSRNIARLRSGADERLPQRARLRHQLGERVLVERRVERVEGVDEDALQPAGRRDPAGARIFVRQAFYDRRGALARPHDGAEADLFRRP